METKKECYVRWSVIGVDLNAINNTMVAGKVIFIRKHDDFWGEGKDYKRETVESPTWLQAATFANESMTITGDLNHVFFEGIDIDKVEDSVTYVTFSMVS